MFKDIRTALKSELKNVIFKSWFHLIRYGGLLLIPLIYGFSYIFAFYDPFPKINNLKVSVITGTKAADPFGYALGESLKKAHVKIGDLNMDLSMEHIYIDENQKQDVIDQKTDDIKKTSYATIEARGSNGFNLTQGVAESLKEMIDNSGHIDTFSLIDKMKNLKEIHFEVTPNFKKNYLVAFGVNVGTSMQGTYITAIRSSLETLTNPDFLDAKDPSDTTKDMFTEDQKNIIKEYVEKLKEAAGKDGEYVNPVSLNTNMSEHSKYGFGLAPFFISVAMWVGGMTMTFAVHRKIYKKSVTPGHRYFAKWLLIIFGTFIQATILMAALYFIGFNGLGANHWGAMYGFTILIGIVFASIIQAIRFTIHSRNIGIFITIILLVLQMASAGGLFPIQTQNGFYNFLNIILPMSKSVNIIRETSFDTDWGHLFTQLGFLFIYLLIVPFAVIINHYRTIRIYIANDFTLPESTKKWIEYRNYRISKVKKRRANRKLNRASRKGGV